MDELSCGLLKLEDNNELCKVWVGKHIVVQDLSASEAKVNQTGIINTLDMMCVRTSMFG